MPYVTERWPGGMLTNFPTIRKAVKKMASIDKMQTDGTFNTLSKREKLQVMRQRAKLEKNLGSISDLTRLPAALFIVDITKEHISVREAKRLGIPVFAMTDTNSNPNLVDFPIPANDDASKSISLIADVICNAIQEGLVERKAEKDAEPVVEKKPKDTKKVKSKGIKRTVTVEATEVPEEVIEEVIKDVIKVDVDVKKAPIKKKVRKEEE
jgi:small subunit ribosomal protein S2